MTKTHHFISRYFYTEDEHNEIQITLKYWMVCQADIQFGRVQVDTPSPPSIPPLVHTKPHSDDHLGSEYMASWHPFKLMSVRTRATHEHRRPLVARHKKHRNTSRNRGIPPPIVRIGHRLQSYHG